MNYITILKIVLPILVGAFVLGRKRIIRSLPLSSLLYVMAWFAYVLIIFCLFALDLLLALISIEVHLEDLFSEYKWIIHGVVYAMFVLAMLVKDSSTSIEKSHNTKAAKVSTIASLASAAITQKSDTKTKRSNKPRINIKEIKDKLANGISVTVDWSQIGLSDIDSIISIAKKSGASITFYNIEKIDYQATIDNMAMFARKAPGKVIYKTPLDSGFNALAIAKSGAHFVCDNSKGSSLIGNIARASKESNGHVTFINCSKSSISELKRLKQECGDNIEFR